MELSNTLIEYLKNRLSKNWHTSVHSILDVVKKSEEDYVVTYISETHRENQAPKFDYHFEKININKSLIRDEKISSLLNSIREEPEFDVESIIFTEEQREKLELLRNTKAKDTVWVAINKIKKDYSESFHIGQRVWYNMHPGIITFKHADKDDVPVTRWTVVVKDTEYRYVNGTDIAERKQSDLTWVPIDEELNKLSTDKLLKMYKRGLKRNQGRGSVTIKRILNEREHIGSKEKKIVIVNK